MPRYQLLLACLIPAAYFVGSVPFGLMVGLARGVDVRKGGSGNIGATNVGRLLGKRWFAVVFTLDFLKGMVPAMVAAIVVHRSGQVPNLWDYLLWLLVAFATIVGHMFSLFLRFKGGKGVATSAGVLFGVFPYFTIPGVVAVLVWIIVFRATRYISIASIVGTVAFSITYFILGLWLHWPIFGTQLPLLVFAVFVPAMIVIKHRSNLARLRQGTEPRYESSREPLAPKSVEEIAN
jgi:glycerol-3-phosphate acyltransferase PlsY